MSLRLNKFEFTTHLNGLGLSSDNSAYRRVIETRKNDNGRHILGHFHLVDDNGKWRYGHYIFFDLEGEHNEGIIIPNMASKEANRIIIHNPDMSYWCFTLNYIVPGILKREFESGKDCEQSLIEASRAMSKAAIAFGAENCLGGHPSFMGVPDITNPEEIKSFGLF